MKIFLSLFSLVLCSTASFADEPKNQWVHLRCLTGPVDVVYGALLSGKETPVETGIGFLVDIRPLESTFTSVTNPKCIFDYWDDNKGEIIKDEFNATTYAKADHKLRKSCLPGSTITFYDDQKALLRQLRKDRVGTFLTTRVSKGTLVRARRHYVSDDACVLMEEEK